MNEDEPPADRAGAVDIAATPTEPERGAIPTRRRLLQALTGAGSLLLAGCGGTESSTPTGTTHERSGQTFRAPTRNDPQKTSFFRGGHPLQTTAYATVAKDAASWQFRRFLRESGVWVSGRFVPGPGTGLHFNWLEDLTITPTEVALTIGEDAAWSDGHPITGTDLALVPLELTLRRYFSPPMYAPDTEGDPNRVRFAYDDFEIGDRSVTYRSSQGHFANFWDIQIALNLGTIYFPTLSPTHKEPFGAYADAVIETARRAQAGEIYPWYGRGIGDPHRESLIEEHLGRATYVKKFSKPKHVLSTGPWDLVELDGEEFVFEPNPHHRHADEINFQRFVFAYTPSDERERAALKADRFDYAAPGTVPQPVVDALPDHIEPVGVPFGGSDGLGVSFDHPALGKRSVRQALMYALNHETIATNIHPTVAVPVTTPGGDAWNATDYVSQGWIDENLTTYSQDRARAATLMREAGYTMSGGQWVDPDGKPFTLTLPTPSTTPTWEPTVASQLSEFGVDVTVRTVVGTTFQDRKENGEFSIWASNTAFASAAAPLHLWRNAVTQRYRGLYSDDQYETGTFSNSGTPLPRTEARWRAFTIEAPPLGDPDGPLQEYHPASLGLAFWTSPSDAEYYRRVKTGLWLVNWMVPVIPIDLRYAQHFIDDVHWQWPTDTPSWQSFVGSDIRLAQEMLRNNHLRANPDNPKKEA